MSALRQFQKLPLRALLAVAILLSSLVATALFVSSPTPVSSQSSSTQGSSTQGILAPNLQSSLSRVGVASSDSTATSILSGIYPQSSVTTTPFVLPRLLLAETSSTVFAPEGLHRVAIDGETLFRDENASRVRISLVNNRWQVSTTSSFCPSNGCGGDILRLHFATATSVHVAATGNSYFHGRFTLIKTGSDTFHIVLDTLHLEDYLKGLDVANLNWSTSSLQARAIEARSYAVATFHERRARATWSSEYELFEDAPDLPYVGDDVERNPNAAAWISAVISTTGQVLTSSSPTAVRAPQAATSQAETQPASVPTTTAPATTPAQASPQSASVSSGGNFTFSGRGWGHGVGMSQYGARGRAAAGHSYNQILNFYYPGTQLTNAPASLGFIRIYLALESSSNFRPLGSGSITLGDGSVLSHVAPSTLISVSLSGGAWHITAGGTALCPSSGCSSSTVHLNFATGSSMRVGANGRSYFHGRITLSKYSSSHYRIVLDTITMEDYLRGIAEMPSDWESEALKAQAVAARSYAYAIINDRRSNPSWTLPFDIYSSTNDQFYIGDTRELAPTATGWLNAVTSTANQVLLSNGAYAVTHYSSSNGGYVSSDTFRSGAAKKSYLRATPDSFDSYTNPFASWQVTFSATQLSSWLNANNDTSVGTLRSVSITGQREASGRVNPATVVLSGTSGTRTVSGSRFYAVVNAGSLRAGGGSSRTLRSTLFNAGTTYPSVTSGGQVNQAAAPVAAPPRPSVSTAIQTSPVAPVQSSGTSRVGLTGNFSALRYEGGQLIATGTARVYPRDRELGVYFLVDEQTEVQGDLNVWTTLTFAPGFRLSGHFAFRNVLDVGPGAHTVCMYVRDSKEDKLVSCRTIGLPPQLPRAEIIALASPANGQLRLSGWAYDIDNILEPVTARVLLDGSYLPPIPANQRVSAQHIENVPKLAADRGWATTVSNLTAGSHQICVWIGDTNSHRSAFLGCQTIRVG